VNLNEVGALIRSGRRYGGTGEASLGAANAHQARMEGIQEGFRGLGGSRAQEVAALGSQTTVQLAQHFVDQARRAELAEMSALSGDEEAHQAQQAAHSSTESSQQGSIRPINY
jgi:hypothetical protein